MSNSAEKGLLAAITRALMDHAHGGVVNSRLRWTECLCEQRIPWYDHEDLDEHDDSLRAHIAAEIARVTASEVGGSA